MYVKFENPKATQKWVILSYIVNVCELFGTPCLQSSLIFQDVKKDREYTIVQFGQQMM